MSIYRKLFVAVYRMPAFRRLSPVGKLVLIGVLTGPGSLSVPGLFEGDANMLAGALAIDLAAVENALNELVTAQLVEVDADHGLIIVTWTDAYNEERPANPSVAKGWMKTFANVIGCPARDRHLDRLVSLFSELAAHRGPHGVDTVTPTVTPRCPPPCRTPSPHGVDTVTPFSNSNSNSKKNKHADHGGSARVFGEFRLAPEAILGASAPPRLDFEGAYAAYPRKEGKSAGLKICQRSIKTAGDLESLRKAIANYSAQVRAEGREPKHVKHFGTFMNCWRDYLEPPTTVRVVSSGAARPAEAVLADALGEGS